MGIPTLLLLAALPIRAQDLPSYEDPDFYAETDPAGWDWAQVRWDILPEGIRRGWGEREWERVQWNEVPEGQWSRVPVASLPSPEIDRILDAGRGSRVPPEVFEKHPRLGALLSVHPTLRARLNDKKLRVIAPKGHGEFEIDLGGWDARKARIELLEKGEFAAVRPGETPRRLRLRRNVYTERVEMDADGRLRFAIITVVSAETYWHTVLSDEGDLDVSDRLGADDFDNAARKKLVLRFDSGRGILSGLVAELPGRSSILVRYADRLFVPKGATVKLGRLEVADAPKAFKIITPTGRGKDFPPKDEPYLYIEDMTPGKEVVMERDVPVVWRDR